MQFENDFEVAVGVARVWEVMADVEKVAPCLPGARLDGPVEGSDGEQYEGVVKVKVGPITADYKGKATILERNKDNLQVVIRAEGRDTRGAGNAAADVTAVLTAVSDDRTKVSVVTDLKISGKVAQFGRGVMGDVSAKLMERFAQNLEGVLLADEAEEADTEEASDGDAGSSSSASSKSAAQEASGASGGASAEPEAVDLLDAVGSSRLKKAGAAVAAVAAVGLLIRRLVKRRRG